MKNIVLAGSLLLLLWAPAEAKKMTTCSAAFDAPNGATVTVSGVISDYDSEYDGELGFFMLDDGRDPKCSPIIITMNRLSQKCHDGGHAKATGVISTEGDELGGNLEATKVDCTD